MVEIYVKYDFLLKNEILPCTNVGFVYKVIPRTPPPSQCWPILDFTKQYDMRIFEQNISMAIRYDIFLKGNINIDMIFL